MDSMQNLDRRLRSRRLGRIFVLHVRKAEGFVVSQGVLTMKVLW